MPRTQSEPVTQSEMMLEIENSVPVETGHPEGIRSDGSPTDGSPSDGSPSDGSPSDGSPSDGSAANGHVTFRAFALGLAGSALLAWLNAWLEIQANVHFLGGVQMPFGAIFGLLFLVLFVNGPIRWLLQAVPALRRVAPPLAPAELLTVYAMLLFATLISTPGTSNFYLSTGPALFYFASRENRWADLFYQYVPAHFAPGWNGKTYQKEVIEPFYTGGLEFSQIPWHAWTVMLVSWSVLLLLVYATLFFTSLLLRRQWIENEALTFPLAQLPLQMVDTSGGSPSEGFWTSRTMWGGFALAAVFHFLRGMNNYFPDWPAVNTFQGNAYRATFTEAPWNAMGDTSINFYFGGIGIAFLLTRELSFSFWIFYFVYKLQMVGASMLGYPAASLPRDTYLGRPLFATWQSTGGWLMLAALLLWTARGHISMLWRQALRPREIENDSDRNEPFSARVIFVGLALSGAGVLAWCWYSGIGLLPAIVFFTLHALVSIVLARLVVEGGFLFPQVTFSPMEAMTTGFLGAAAVGPAGITRLTFLNPMIFGDMRTNVMPGFLNTLKISHALGLDRRDSRRMLLAVVCAILLTLAVSTVTAIATVYRNGGLTGYDWFTQGGPKGAFNGAAAMLRDNPTVQPSNLLWLASGAGAVWLMTVARAHFMWFPLHPLGFITSSGYPITQLWFSFFVGWAVKSLVLRFGGQDTLARVRPFMIGLILGNVVAMVIWMLFGMWKGSQIPYWSA